MSTKSTSIMTSFDMKAVKKFLDNRDGFDTMEHMKACPAELLPDGFISSCQEKEYFGGYIYNSQNEEDAIMGKWRPLNKTYKAPVVKINAPTETYFEKGSSVDNLEISATITPSNDGKVVKWEVWLGTTKVKEEEEEIDEETDVSYTHTSGITEDIVLKVVAIDNNGSVGYDEIPLIFTFKKYIGVVASDKEVADIDATTIKELANTDLKDDANYSYKNIVATGQKVLYAYPSAYGDLTDIVDGNGFKMLDSYDEGTATVENTYGQTAEYKFYLLGYGIYTTAEDKVEQNYILEE